MLTLKKKIAEAITAAVGEKYPAAVLTADEIAAMLEYPPDAAMGSVDFSAEEFLQSAVYGNTDVLLRSLHNVGKEYTPEGLTIKPFSSQDISTITTRQMLLWTVGLSVVPALVIAGAGAVILIRRRRA